MSSGAKRPPRISDAKEGDVARVVAIDGDRVTIQWLSGKVSVVTKEQAEQLFKKVKPN